MFRGNVELPQIFWVTCADSPALVKTCLHGVIWGCFKNQIAKKLYLLAFPQNRLPCALVSSLTPYEIILVTGCCGPEAPHQRAVFPCSRVLSRDSRGVLEWRVTPKRCISHIHPVFPLPQQWINKLLTALVIRRKNRTKCKLQLCCMDQKGSLFQQFLVLNSAAIKGNTACFRTYLHWKWLLNTEMWPSSCRLWWSYPWVVGLEKACR